MPRNQDNSSPPPQDSFAADKRNDKVIQRFEVAMEAQKEEFQQAF